MLHIMNLNAEPFNAIKNKTKTMEFRLYDEKRQLINLNDTIKFINLSDTNQSISVKVIGLLHYNSFEDLFNNIPYNNTNENKSVAEKTSGMRRFYSKESEQKYGVLAINIEVL